MSPRVVRRVVIAVCVAGIAGMIVSSIADNTGAALTAGLVTAIAVLCLIVATAVTGAHGVGISDLPTSGRWSAPPSSSARRNGDHGLGCSGAGVGCTADAPDAPGAARTFTPFTGCRQPENPDRMTGSLHLRGRMPMNPLWQRRRR